MRFTIFIPEAGKANSEYSDICVGIKQLFLEMLGVMRTRVSLVSVHSSTTYHFFLIVCANLHAYIVHALSFSFATYPDAFYWLFVLGEVLMLFLCAVSELIVFQKILCTHLQLRWYLSTKCTIEKWPTLQMLVADQEIGYCSSMFMCLPLF